MGGAIEMHILKCFIPPPLRPSPSRVLLASTVVTPQLEINGNAFIGTSSHSSRIMKFVIRKSGNDMESFGTKRRVKSKTKGLWN